MTEKTAIGFGRSLRVGVYLGSLGAFALIACEGACFLFGPNRFLFNRPGEYGLFAAHLLGVVLFWGALIGLGEGLFSWAVFKIPGGAKQFNLPALLIAAAYALGLYAYEWARNGVWAGLHHPLKGHLYLEFLVLATVVCLPLVFPLYRLQKRRFALASGDRTGESRPALSRLAETLALGAAVAFLYWINARFYPREYPYIHNMFVIAAFWLGELFFLSALPPGRRPRPPSLSLTAAGLAVAICALLSFSFFSLDRNQNVKRIVLLETPVASKAVRWLQRLVDFDRDGYSPILGGGDRDDGNPRVNPGAYDAPGNGVDEDGYGGDRKLPAPAVRRTPAGIGKGWSVFFIHFDSARADHLGCYGYGRKTTPNIDRVAGEGTLFLNALSPSSKTIFSMNAIMTSRYFNEFRRAGNPMNLAQILAASGYETAVFGPEIGFEPFDIRSFRVYQGFSHVRLFPPVPGGAEDPLSGRLNRAAMDFIERRRDDRLFVWMEYYDAHAPYFAHAETARWGSRPLDLYDGEIAHADRLFGEFLDRLKEVGLFERSLIVIFSDNGEEFREHGSMSHATSLYQEQVHVPLIIRAPGLQPEKVEAYVSLIDLMPTVLDVLGDAIPPGLDGESLLPFLERARPAPPVRPVYLENPKPQVNKRAVLLYPWKMVFDYRYNTFELYDLARDPGERKNVFDYEPAAAERLRELLFSY